MKLTTRQDIEAPLDFVFAQLTDFEQFERMAMRRGAEVERTDRLIAAGPGMGWRLKFHFRGKPRKVHLRFTDAEPGQFLLFAVDGEMIDGTGRGEMMSLSARRTRLTITVEIHPKTLAARLMVQSMRLARGRVQRKFDNAAAKLTALIEDRWAAAARR
jgi:uncharacterized protein YndB with AHSA1/START domain